MAVDGKERGGGDDPKLRELVLQYLRVRRLLDQELAPRRRLRGEPRPLVGSPLYPQEALRDLSLFFYLMALVCLLASLAPPHLGDPANPDVTPDRLLPDWYLLWAFGLLKVAPNISVFDVELVSGKFLGVMLVVLTFLVVLLVPWVDRAISYLARRVFRYPVTFSEGRKARRPMADPVMASLGAAGVAYAVMGSVFSIHEVIEETYEWIEEAHLVAAFALVPLLVGLGTYGGLRAARRTDDYEWRLNLCYGCGTCDQVCPVRPARGEPRLNLVSYVHTETDVHVWTCLGCDRCSASCPQGIVFSEHTLRMRRRAGSRGGGERAPQQCRDLMAWHSRRAAEAGIVEKPPPGAGEGRVGYFPGCMSTLELTRVSHDFEPHREGALRLLRASGASVHELGTLCCGHDALWQGEVGTFERLRERNTEAIVESGVSTVVTECAECYRTLSRDYDLGDVEVVHLSEYLDSHRLPSLRGAVDGEGTRAAEGTRSVEGTRAVEVTEGTAAPVGAGAKLRVAYHDPCRLGRHMGVYDAPRRLLRAVPGVDLVELEESRERSRCCGVAAMMNCDRASRELRVTRMDQVLDTGADVLVTTCPKCVAHMVCLQDEGDRYPFSVQDLSEFLAGRLPPGTGDEDPEDVARAAPDGEGPEDAAGNGGGEG